MSLPALRQQLAAILAPPRAGDAAAIPSGIEALDRALSDGGVPSGRLTEIQGARGSGRTTLVRQMVLSAVESRRWVAVIDGSRTLAPREWARAGDSRRLWVIRPPGADKSAWCADILLRSGAFSLVVLDSPPALPRAVVIRLTRLAKEHDVALIVVGDTPVIGSAVRLRVKRIGKAAASDSRPPHHDLTVSRPHALPTSRPHDLPTSRSRITICIDKGGTQHAVEVSCAFEMARRLRAHPEVPDRRGVATRNRRGEKIDSPHRRPTGAGPAVPEHREPGTEKDRGTLPYKRRFGEAYAKRDEFILGNRGPERKAQNTKRRASRTKQRAGRSA